MNFRLATYAEKNDMIGEEQGGFREGYGTIGHAFVLGSLIEIYKQSHRRLYCAFIDYKKAFDLDDRSSLWTKMLKENVDGKFLKVIYALYDNAKSCVRKGGEISEYFSCNVGVRQGENLSPLLFAIYLNDFEKALQPCYAGLNYIKEITEDEFFNFQVLLKLYVLLYADDTVVLAESDYALQMALNAAYSYCKKWKLTVNVDKTKIVIFSRGRVTKHFDFTFNGERVDVVDEYIYLGVLFNYNGLYAKAISKQISQARKAMFSFLTKARRLLLPIDVVIDLFDKCVVPILLYGCEIWGHTDLDKIEFFLQKVYQNSTKCGNLL